MKKLIASFIKHVQTEKGYSRHTIRNYEFEISTFLEYVDEYLGKNSKDISRIDNYLFRSYLAKLFKSRKAVSVNRSLSAIRSFFAYLERESVVQYNLALTVNMPKMQKKLPKVLSVDDMFAILDGINSTTPGTEKPYSFASGSIATRSLCFGPTGSICCSIFFTAFGN